MHFSQLHPTNLLRSECCFSSFHFRVLEQYIQKEPASFFIELNAWLSPWELSDSWYVCVKTAIYLQTLMNTARRSDIFIHTVAVAWISRYNCIKRIKNCHAAGVPCVRGDCAFSWLKQKTVSANCNDLCKIHSNKVNQTKWNFQGEYYCRKDFQHLLTSYFINCCVYVLCM